MIPNGARLIIHFTICETIFDMSSIMVLVAAFAKLLAARPNTTAQKRMPIYCPLAIASIGFETIVKSRLFKTCPILVGVVAPAFLAVSARTIV